jgi:hypothetical protein
MKEVELFCEKCGYRRVTQVPTSDEEKNTPMSERRMQVFPKCPICGSKSWTYTKPKG